jgi:hypothetical protein
MSVNRAVWTQTSRRFPDILIQARRRAAVVEVDEFQHRTYSVADEVARMQQIAAVLHAQGVEGPVLFLRFNPDAYTPPRGGRAHRIDERLAALRERLLLLLCQWEREGATAAAAALPPAPVLLQVEYLFYDGFQPPPWMAAHPLASK